MTDTINLTIPSGARFRPVVTLVLSGIGTRMGLPYEQVDDLQLAVLSVLVAIDGETLTVTAKVDEQRLAVTVGPLVAGSSSDNGLLLVLERLVDRVDATAAEGQEWLTLGLDKL